MRRITTENPGKDVRRYLQHWAVPKFVDEKLAERHKGLRAEQRRERARDIAVCIEQGLEYLAAGELGSMLTRPLPLFYAAENLAKATCVFVDPSLGADDFKAHGLSHDSSRRYSVKALRASITKPGSDVFSRYLALGNHDRLALAIREDGKGIITDIDVNYRTKGLPAKKELSLGQLLRGLPELFDDLVYAAWDTPHAIHVSSYSFASQSGPPRTVTGSMMLRHRHHGPTKDLILRQQKTRLRDYQLAEDRLDVLRFDKRDPKKVELPAFKTDIFGQPYIDLNPTRIDLSEPIIYLISLFILSSAARYEPGQWHRLLEARPAEAILVEHVMDLASRKLPNLILNTLHREVFQFTVSAS